MRTRLLGGVGGVPEQWAPIPIVDFGLGSGRIIPHAYSSTEGGAGRAF